MRAAATVQPGSVRVRSVLGGCVSIIWRRWLSSARSTGIVGQREDIALAAHGPQELRVRGIVLDLLPQPHDADVDGARRFRVLVEADGVRYRGAAEQPVAAGKEHLEHVEFALG